MKRLLFLILTLTLLQLPAFSQDDFPELPDSIALAINVNRNNDLRYVDALADAVEYLFDESRYFEALPLINVMSATADRLGKPSAEATAHFYRGTLCLLADSLPEAYTHLRTADLLLTQNVGTQGNELLALRIKTTLASYYLITSSNYTEAYRCLTDAKKFNKVVKSEGYEYLININTIRVLNSLGLNDEAISVGKEISADTTVSGTRNFSIYLNIADNYLKMNADTARMYYDTAFMLAKNRYEEAKAVYKLGLCDNAGGNHIGAMLHFNRCLRTYSDAINHELTSLLLIEKGRTHFELHEYDSALIYINKGVESASQYGFTAIELDGYQSKCDVLNHIRDYKGYAQCLTDYYILKDSVEKLNNADEVARLMLESQMKDTEVQMAHDMQLAEMRRSRLIFILIIVTVALVSAVVIFSLSLSRKRVMLRNKELSEKALAAEIEKQNRELMQQSLIGKQRQELIADITDKLKLLQYEKRPRTSDIKEVVGTLEDYDNLAIPADFEYYFTKTNPDFFRNLLADYPNLTIAEQKLCAYIKLNLSVKDISNICKITVKSVHQSRYRLKKKLGLENDGDIETVIGRY